MSTTTTHAGSGDRPTVSRQRWMSEFGRIHMWNPAAVRCRTRKRQLRIGQDDAGANCKE